MATTFEMTPETLARAIANAAKRERRRAAQLLDDRSNVELGKGNLPGAQLLIEMAEAVRSSDIPEPVTAVQAGDLGDGDRDYHQADRQADELPPVHHLDDFEEGAALVRSGADRRLVVGYNGAAGHLRD